MITLQIDTNDKKKIEEFLALGVSRFDFKIKITSENNPKTNKISSHIDQKIKSSKPINTQKSKRFISAIDGLNALMDPKKTHLSLEQAKEKFSILKYAGTFDGQLKDVNIKDIKAKRTKSL